MLGHDQDRGRRGKKIAKAAPRQPVSRKNQTFQLEQSLEIAAPTAAQRKFRLIGQALAHAGRQYAVRPEAGARKVGLPMNLFPRTAD